jgi:hypothetical protein
VTDDWGKIPEEDEGKLNQLWKKVFAFLSSQRSERAR